MSSLRRVAAAVGTAALLALPACSSGDDTQQLTVAVAGPPYQPAQDVQVQLDGPVQRELSVETGGNAAVALPPGEYAVTVNGRSDVCPDRLELGDGDLYVSLLWPVPDGSCPGGEPTPASPGAVPPSPVPPELLPPEE